MKVLAMVCLAIALALFSVATANENDPVATRATTADFRAQLEATAVQVQSDIVALEEKLIHANELERQSISIQISDVKRKGEVNRLRILLEWALREKDTRRVTELQTALEQWQNPPVQQLLPEHAKSERAPAGSGVKTFPINK
jgi:hypothetical protein